MVSKKGFPKPKSIDAYIAEAPEEAHDKLNELLDCIRQAAPGANESLKWGMPAFSYKRILVTFALFKNHIGFYPTPSVVKAFEISLSKYKTAASTIQFPLDKPLPLALIRKITLFRVKQSMEEDIKWKD
ncbi:MAG: iron chaperone [Chitinophagaceae bacterium]